MKKSRRHLASTQAAVSTLGSLITEGRRARGWTAAELAERLGISAPTLTRIERGEPTVAIGVVLDAAVLCGVNLFDTDPRDLGRLAETARLRAALLPARIVRDQVRIDDDF